MNNNFLQDLQQLRNNPIQFLMKRKFNVPQNIGNNPNNIAQYLLNTGQVSQEQYNQAAKLARQFVK